MSVSALEPRQNGISKLEPSEFQIGDDDETYMIGAEVGYVMGLEKGQLYQRYPLLWRRHLTNLERHSVKMIRPKKNLNRESDLIGHLAKASVVKAVDVKALLNGDDAQFKVTEQKTDFEMELGDDEGFHIDNYSGNENSQSDDQQLILVSSNPINGLDLDTTSSIYQIFDRPEGQVLVCDICSQEFTDPKSIKQHKREVHRYQCDQCANNYTGNEHYLIHGMLF